ncbi:hypothetical protein HOD20_08945 [archaeon]|jgi:hypothetical protein|nr:hypothetical protein [archaeon]MBT4352636.1 hypothetical protein [archaeon]MBT4647236.1 hypothetical protein [archaeon]MBT6821027.1 hypothetical protein [archaeon]MBT7391456.1 hypothetical protein [archaeon]
MARIRRSKTNTTFFLDIPKEIDENVDRKKKWKSMVKSESNFFSHSEASKSEQEA